MNHECPTNHQGRAPCTCGGMHTDNSDGSNPGGEPLDWVSDLRDSTLQTIALVACAVVLGTVVFLIFK